MISLSEGDLASYLDIRDSKLNGRFLNDRVFRGVVKSVQAPASAVAPNSFSGPFMVTVQRVGDAVPDLTRYACSVPGYAPFPGDTVDLIWRSKSEAIVFQPVSWKPLRARAHAATAQTIPISANTKIQLPTVDSDPTGSFDAVTNYRFTAPLPGYYQIFAGIQLAAQVGFNMYIAINGNLNTGQGVRFSNAANATAAAQMGSDGIHLNVNDFVELWVFVATATTLDNGAGLLNSTFLSISYVGP